MSPLFFLLLLPVLVNTFGLHATAPSRYSTTLSASSRKQAVDKLLKIPNDLSIKFSNKIVFAVTRTGDVSLSIKSAKKNGLIASIPSALSLSIFDPPLESDDSNTKNISWSSKLSLQLHELKKTSTANNDNDTNFFRNWLAALPCQPLLTPFHFSESMLSQLHYPHMTTRIAKQREQWTKEYESINDVIGLTFDALVWGCEIARSRAFSSEYTPPFDAKPYAFTIVLVIGYVLGGFGSIEQASNGAAVVRRPSERSERGREKENEERSDEYQYCRGASLLVFRSAFIVVF